VNSNSNSKNYVASFPYDIRLAPYDIEGSIAHALMLGRQGIVPRSDVKKIVQGLKSILKDLGKGWKLPADEDIHFAIERELIRRTGKAGQRLHTGRSRNDQTITDLFLYLRDQIQRILFEIKRLQGEIVKVAKKNTRVVMPGFTHLQHAQPILFSHHILAYAWMLERDKGRLKDLLRRMDVLPLGSAAIGGTSFPIDRKFTAKLLDFNNLSENSIDATASRDMAIEFLSAGSILMSQLSRLAEELVVWSSPEFSFVDLADEFTTGSSIMPQKRNPDVAEIIRGETGRVYGSLVALLTIVKGLPLGYNRDLQGDKPPVFDTVDTVMGSLSVMAPMIGSMKVHGQDMKRWCDTGFIAATLTISPCSLLISKRIRWIWSRR